MFSFIARVIDKTKAVVTNFTGRTTLIWTDGCCTAYMCRCPYRRPLLDEERVIAWTDKSGWCWVYNRFKPNAYLCLMFMNNFLCRTNRNLTRNQHRKKQHKQGQARRGIFYTL